MIAKSFKRLTSLLGDKSFSEILKGSSWAFGLKVIAMVFGFLSTLVISKYYGPRTIGQFNLSFTIISIISLFSLMGFPTSILRFVGEFKDDNAQQLILKKMLTISFGMSLIFVAVFYLSADYISVNFFHDQELKKFIYVMLIGAPLGILSTILIEYIRGLRLIMASETIRNLMFVFNFIVILFLVFIARFGHLTPAAANVVAAALVFFIALIYVVKRSRCQHYKKTTHVSYKEILVLSAPMMLTASMFLIMGLSDKLMLGFFKTTYEVGIYTVALKLATITSMVLVAINAIVAPKISELYWANKLDDLRRIIRFSSGIIFFSSAPVFIIYFLFSHQILSIFGKEFIQGAVALIILSVGQLINSASGSVGHVLEMTGHHLVFRNIVFIASMINICLNFLLIPMYGYNGAAIATAVSMVLWNILALVYAKLKFNLFVGYNPFQKVIY